MKSKVNESVKTEFINIDFLKFIAIFCVCFYHFSWVEHYSYSTIMNMNNWITTFFFIMNSICVPLFFMINGFLMGKSNLKFNKQIKKIIHFLSQFFIWRIITIVILSFFLKIDLLSMSKSTLFNLFFLLGNAEGLDMSHFWFLPAFITVYLIAPFFVKEDRDSTKYSIFLLIWLFISCFFVYDWKTIIKLFPSFRFLQFTNFDLLNPFYGLTGPLLLYFLIGSLISKNIEKLKKWKKSYSVILFIVADFVLLGKWYIESKNMNITWDGVFGGYNSIPTLLMTISIFLFFIQIPNEKFKYTSLIKVLGRNTLNVYYMHWIFGYTILPFLHKIFPYNGLIINSIKSLLIVFFFSILSEYLKKVPILKKLLH